MKIALHYHIPISYIFREKNRQRALWLVRAGSGRARCDSASSKIVIKIHFNYFRFFLKVLELFECRRGNPYKTANRNFVRIAHS